MPVRVFSKGKVLRRVLRRECFIEGAQKVLRRQKHVPSQSTTPFACTLSKKAPSTRSGRCGLVSGFRKRGRRNGVASDFFRFFPFFSVSFRFLSVFFRFFPFFSVFFRFFPFSSVFFVSFSEKKRGDTVRETPFAKPRL